MSVNIPLDKQAHAWAGAAIAATLMPHAGAWWALLACVAAALARELAGNRDPRDFWATVAGGVGALSAAHLLQWAVPA